MKYYLCALVLVFSLNALGATVADRGDIVIEPTPQHFKVMGIKLDVAGHKALVKLSKHSHHPQDIPGPFPVREAAEDKCPGCGKVFTLSLDLSDAMDQGMYAAFLSTKQGCDGYATVVKYVTETIVDSDGNTKQVVKPIYETISGCHCGCVQLLIANGKVVEMSLEKSGGCDPVPFYRAKR